VVSRLFVLVFVLLAFRIGAAEAMEIERVVSPGGIEAWLVEEPSIPVIVMEAAWKGGTATDPAEKAGLANMVSGLLDEGAGGLTSAEFQERLDDIAAKMSFSAESDYFTASLTTLADRRSEAFELFSLAITEPRFDEDAVERIRAQIGAIVSRNRDSPDWIAADAWYKAALGGHPYALANEGTPDSIPRIERADLAGFARRVFARDNLKIAVVGAIS